MAEVWVNLPLVPLLMGAYFIWLVGASVSLVLARRPPVATLAWLMALMFLPILGGAIYYFLGPRRLRRRRLRFSLARQKIEPRIANLQRFTASANLPLDERWQQLARQIKTAGDGWPLKSAEVALYDNGDGCFDAIEAAIHGARHHVHVEFYIWKDDDLGAALAGALTAAARRGIKVRLLLDALGAGGISARYFDALIAAGGELLWFNMLLGRRWRPSLINFRTHRKIVVVDGDVGFTGGMNVVAHHASRYGEPAWRDTHLKLVGAPVSRLQHIFLDDWQYALDTNLQSYGATVELTPEFFPKLRDSAQGPWVQVVDSGPDDVKMDIHHAFFTLITSAQRSIDLTTPYFVPDDALLTALATAHARGVKVRLLIPRQADSFLVNAAGITFGEDLARLGAQVFLYQPAMLHAKTLVIDDEIGVVGTANFDNRSFRLNFEVIAILYDRRCAGELREQFERDLLDSKPLDAGAVKKMLVPQRLIENIARLFSPLL